MLTRRSFFSAPIIVSYGNGKSKNRTLDYNGISIQVKKYSLEWVHETFAMHNMPLDAAAPTRALHVSGTIRASDLTIMMGDELKDIESFIRSRLNVFGEEFQFNVDTLHITDKRIQWPGTFFVWIHAKKPETVVIDGYHLYFNPDKK